MPSSCIAATLFLLDIVGYLQFRHLAMPFEGFYSSKFVIAEGVKTYMRTSNSTSLGLRKIDLTLAAIKV